jgi:hypothetical protein
VKNRTRQELGLAADEARKAAYQKLRPRYEALDDEGREIYQRVMDIQEQQRTDFVTVLERRAQGLGAVDAARWRRFAEAMAESERAIANETSKAIAAVALKDLREALEADDAAAAERIAGAEYFRQFENMFTTAAHAGHAMPAITLYVNMFAACALAGYDLELPPREAVGLMVILGACRLTTKHGRLSRLLRPSVRLQAQLHNSMLAAVSPGIENWRKQLDAFAARATHYLKEL